MRRIVITDELSVFDLYERRFLSLTRAQQDRCGNGQDRKDPGKIHCMFSAKNYDKTKVRIYPKSNKYKIINYRYFLNNYLVLLEHGPEITWSVIALLLECTVEIRKIVEPAFVAYL